MRTQRVIGTVFVPRFDHLHNKIMFRLRNGTAPLNRQRRCRQQRHRPVHQIKLLHQISVMGRKVDLLVKPPVGPCERPRGVTQRVVGLNHLAQHADLLGGGVARGQTRS